MDLKMAEDTPGAYRDFGYIAVWSAILLTSILFVHNVATVYAGNVEEFQFQLIHLFIFSVPLFLVSSLVLAGPAILMRRGALRIYASVISFLAILTWLYSNFIVFDFGLLDGQGLRFHIAEDYGLIEIAGIALCAFVCGFLTLEKPRILLFFLVCLNLILLIPTAWAVASDSKNATLKQRPNLNAVYRFSEQQNVLVVLMDAFQSDLFADLLQGDPELSKQLTGFTFFPNTLGVATTTYLTMPTIHTGAPYSTSRTLRDLYRSEVRQGSFLNALARAGHEVSLVNPVQQVCPERIELCVRGNEILHGKWQILLMEIAHMLDLSLFRAVPLRYKESVYNEHYWVVFRVVRSLSRLVGRQENRAIENNRLLELIASRAVVTAERPVTKFFHIFNTHPPYVLDSGCQATKNQPTDRRLAATIQAKCAMDAFLKLTDQLRKNRVYDRTLILLIADTGVGLPSSYAVGAPSAPERWARMLGAANPIFLVKAPNAQGSLRESTLGVQLSDVPATICAVVKDCEASNGVSVLDESSMPPRTRSYNHYRWRHKYWGKDVIPNIVRYDVEGPIWEFDSWVNYKKAVRQVD